MDMERAEDFRTLRAKFQNESSKPSGEISLRQHLGASSTPSPEPKTVYRVQPPEIIPRQGPTSKAAPCAKPRSSHLSQVPDHEQKPAYISLAAAESQLSGTSQKSETTPIKPMVLPRVKLCELSEIRKNNEKKATGSPETPWKASVPVAHPQKQRPVSCGYSQESGLADHSFHSTLRIWESAAALQGDQMSSTLPPQRPKRTTSLAQLSTSNNNSVTVEEKAEMCENVQALTLAAPQKPSQGDLTPFPAVSPPLPPRGQTGSENLTPGGLKIINSSPSTNKMGRPSKTLQSLTERQNDAEELKLPKTKPLPSIVSLGPPPKKPARPPKVDLSPFCRNLPDATDDAYITPEITDDLNMYEESMSYLTQTESSINSDQELAYPPKPGKKEDTKKPYFLTTTPSIGTEDTKGRGPLWNPETTKQAKEIVKISSHDRVLTKPKINGECRGEKYRLQEETTSSFPEEEVTKDGNYGYVCPETLKIDEEQASLDSRPLKLEQPMEDMYDDVEGIQRDLQACEAHRSFASDTCDAYEETYEDIQNEGYGSSKIEDAKVEKLKGFGKLFKKGKFKIKNAQLKDNARNLSRSAPNLDIIAKETIVYNNVSAEQMDTNSSPRTLFRVKKYNLEKNNKMTKEEKLFREKFMYDKEIKVINTAVAHCSNTLTKGKLDLKITAGEQLEVIDVTEGNQLLCRNSEGKYGYVLLEHLDFRH
ncbi:FYN-binding protein 2 isoform X1 [Pogona vitticeps]